MLSFLNPTLAAVGLACVVIPIIIHILMRRRRKPVPWAAMRFIIEAYRKQRRRMNLEQLLLLAARCLLVALLALALGKPILGAAGVLGSRGPRTLYLIIDNSLAAAAAPGRADETELSVSRARALELIDGLDQARGDRVAVIAAASPAEALVLPATPELNSARTVVKDLAQSHARADWIGATKLAREQISKPEAGAGQQYVAMLSAWREGAADLEAAMPPLGSAFGGQAPPTLLVQAPVETPADNVAIIAVEPTRSVVMASGATGANAEAGGTPVRVRLRRSGSGVGAPATTSVTVRMVAPGRPQAEMDSAQGRAIVSWTAGQEQAETFVTLATPAADRSKSSDRPPLFVVASIDADALGPDNKAAAAVQMRERLDVALIATAGSGGAVGAPGSLANYSSADWFALALSPRGDLSLRQRQNGEIRVQVVDPQQGIAPSTAAGGSGRGAGVLTGMDAIIIARPELLDVDAWRAVREVLDGGACVMVCPDAKAQTQVWTEQLKSALGVDWNLGRDPSVLATPAAVRLGAPSGDQATSELLSMIAAELPELIRPVTVSRVLSLVPAGDSYETLLSLSSGEPLLVSTLPADGAAAGSGGVAGANSTGTANGSAVGRRGSLVLFTAAIDLEWMDLPAKPLMVPLMQELVRQGIGRGAGVSHLVAGSFAHAGVSGGADLALVSEVYSDAVSGAPATVGLDAKGQTQGALRVQGGWLIRGGAGHVLGALAVNADSESGSSVAVRSREQVSKWLLPTGATVTWLDREGGPAGPAVAGQAADRGTASAVLGDAPTPPPVSLPLLIAAAVVGLFELFAARWFSHAHQDAFKGASARAASGRKEAASAS